MKNSFFASQPQGGGMSSLLVMVFMFVGLWFLMIAPQRKKQKEHQEMLKNLQVGDAVLTVSGIYGTIVAVKEDRFILKVADDVKIEVNKGFVQTKLALK